VDIHKLKQLGVGEVFPPGSKLSAIVEFVEQNVRVM
jgi:methylmalonyl-CoA mutase cobalamin-binding subunit